MKKPTTQLSLFIDVKGLHWMALEKTKTGCSLSARFSQMFSQILGETELAGQPLAINLIQSAGGAGQIAAWLRSPNVKNAAAEAVKKIGFKGKTAGVCFSEAFSVFRYFTMPRIERMHWARAIPIEARKYVPFPLHDCLFDWKAAEISVSGKTLLGVVFSAMRREIFDALDECLKAAGLECGFIDPLPFAASRAIQAIVQSQKQPLDLTKEDVLVIYLDLEQVQMMLFAKAVPMLGRSIYLADSPNRGSFVLERRKLDLKATFDFVKRQLGLDTLKRIILLGPSILDDESLKNWASGISEELGLKVDIIKPIGAAVASVSDRTWAGSPTPPAGAGHLSVPEALRSGAAVQEKDKQAGALLELADWSEMAAFGAALQGEPAGTASFELNLARSAVGAAPKQKAVKKIWAAVAAAGVVFLGFGFWRSHRAGEMARKAQAVSAKAEEGMPEIKGKNQASLKEMTDSLTGSLGVIRLCGSPDHRIYATYILSALADFAPKEAWLEKVNYAVSGIGTNFGLGAQPTVTLDIAGKVEISQDQPETAAIQEFFKRLKNDPRFSRNFPSGNVAFQKEQRPDAPHQGDLRDAGTLMAFTMNFKNEGK